MELESLYELCTYGGSRVVGVTSTPNWRKSSALAAAAAAADRSSVAAAAAQAAEGGASPDSDDERPTQQHQTVMTDDDSEHVIVTFETMGVHVYRVCVWWELMRCGIPRLIEPLCVIW